MWWGVVWLLVVVMGCAAPPPKVPCPELVDTSMPTPLTMEVYDVGVYPGPVAGPRRLDMTTKRLDQMIRNFYRLQEYVKVPIRLGHGQGIINETGKGDPALGWIVNLERRGTKLYAQATGIPRIVREMMRYYRYRRVSIEFYPQWELTPDAENLKTDAHGDVLTAVTLLGADLPMVKTLKDLAAYL